MLMYQGSPPVLSRSFAQSTADVTQAHRPQMQFCPLDKEAQTRHWPSGATLVKQLWGSEEDLLRTTKFIRTIKPVVTILEHQRRRRSGFVVLVLESLQAWKPFLRPLKSVSFESPFESLQAWKPFLRALKVCELESPFESLWALKPFESLWALKAPF